MKELLNILQKKNAYVFLVKDKAIFSGMGIYGEIDMDFPVEKPLQATCDLIYKVLEVQNGKLNLKKDKLVYKIGNLEAFIPCIESELPDRIEVDNKIYFTKGTLEKMIKIANILKKFTSDISYIDISPNFLALGNDSVYVEIKPEYVDFDKKIKRLIINTDELIIPDNYFSIAKFSDVWVGHITSEHGFVSYIIGSEAEDDFYKKVDNIKNSKEFICKVQVPYNDVKLLTSLSKIDTLNLEKNYLINEYPEIKLLCKIEGKLDGTYILPAIIFNIPSNDDYIEFLICKNNVAYLETKDMKIWVAIGNL
ncbi:hypothetical protein J7J62_04035 [bacterium]|nr:hypothetical protein [bacterium]